MMLENDASKERKLNERLVLWSGSLISNQSSKSRFGKGIRSSLLGLKKMSLTLDAGDERKLRDKITFTFRDYDKVCQLYGHCNHFTLFLYIAGF